MFSFELVTMKCALRVLLVLWALLSTMQASTSHVTTSTWRLEGVGVGTGAEAQQTGVSVQSHLDCVLRCRALSHCSAFVFNPSSRTCLLLPHFNTSLTPYLGQVWADTDPKCDPDEAPAVNGSLQWAHTLTSMMASVTCLDDFTNSTSDVSLQCLADGAWHREGQCVQTVFNSTYPFSYPMPLPILPVVKGWSLCLEGVPTTDQRFTVILVINDNNWPFVCAFRFRFGSPALQHYKTIMSWKKNGSSSPEHFVDNPLSVGQPFTLKITATTEDTLEIYVNTILLHTFSQAPGFLASDIQKVIFWLDVNITRLDLWCFE